MDPVEELKKKLETGGALTSSDLATALQPDAEKEKKAESKSLEAALSETTEHDASPHPATDPLLTADNPAHELIKPTTAKVTITPDDKRRFVEALTTGARVELAFERLGGMIVTVRSRTQAETIAILRRLRHEVNKSGLLNDIEYSARLRAMMLAAQISSLNGVAHEPLAEPLLMTTGATGEQEPGWLAQAARWSTYPDGMVSMLYACVQEFENKYWTMVDEAPNTNFWNPGKSI